MLHGDARARLARLIYPLRVLGMGLGAAVAMVVLDERDASPVRWGLVLFAGFVWPHLAYQWSRRSRHPHRTEVRNLLIDSAFAGAFVPLMDFNLLPSVLLVTLTVADKITPGIRWLWLKSLPGMLGAMALVSWWLDVSVAPDSSMRVVVACLPVLILHTLAVSVASYRRIRKVSEINQQLDELRRIDMLTGLYGRAHWEQEAEAALSRHQATGEPACLLMLDIDGFKQVNDHLGHTVGDDVIRALSHIVRGCVRSSDCAGRYGGDEFALLLRATEPDRALEIAQRIRSQAESHRFRDQPALRFTCSIGIATAQAGHASLRDWVSEADAALYRAKRAGRNRVVHDAPAALVAA